MYSIFLGIYVFLIHLAAPFHKKARYMIQGRRKTFERLEERLRPDDKVLWFHVSSLGEFEQGRPLIEAMGNRYPDYKIVLSFFSPSGYEVRKDYPHAHVVCYLPFDTRRNARRFVKTVHPTAAFFVKYDFWPHILRELRHLSVPTYLVSGIFRPGQAFFRRGAGAYRRLLRGFDCLFVQNTASQELLANIGIDSDKVMVCGDTRSDRVLEISRESSPLILLDSFREKAQAQNARILVAGSTWPKDEEALIPYFNRRHDLRLIVAPHQLSESHLLYLESLLERPSVRFSQLTIEKLAKAECILLDSYGLLSSVYRYGDMAYVGGGFGAGIHNTLEPAVFHLPVAFGPRFQKFDEAKALLANGGAVSVNDEASLQRALDRWLENDDQRRKAGQAAGDYVEQSSGGTQRILDYLSKRLS